MFPKANLLTHGFGDLSIGIKGIINNVNSNYQAFKSLINDTGSVCIICICMCIPYFTHIIYYTRVIRVQYS